MAESRDARAHTGPGEHPGAGHRAGPGVRAALLVIASSILVPASLAPGAAAAQASPGGLRAGSSRSAARLFFATATLGLGDCNQLLCGNGEANTGPSVGVGAGFYVRPIPYFAGGVDLHYQLISADDPDPDHADDAARYYLLNLAVRAIAPLGRVEPWVGVGVGFAGWGHSYDKTNKQVDVTLTGPDIALSLGADVELTDRWRIGGTLRLAFPFWSERCKEEVKPGEVKSACQSVDSLDPPDRDALSNLLWFLGVTGRFEF